MTLKKTLLLLVALTLIPICSHTRQTDAPVPSARMLTARAWADSVASTLTLRQQAGQLIFPRLDVKDDAAGRAQLSSLIRKDGIGGFLLGKGTLKDYKGLIDYAQSLSPIPLMVTLDGEWGLAMRVTDAPRFPHNIALGAIRDTALLSEYGREVARECRLMGIHVNFAPVLDVNSNPANPVIGFRSFGDNPANVGLLATAYARGLEQGGVMSVGKHFPGHGDTSVDSHKALPVISRSRKQLEELELVPFRRYIDAGMSGVMVGHLDIPALDPSGTPASLSQPVVTDLLKGKLGFHGLVWTDALAMNGAKAKSGENNCVSALRAGVDVLLQPAHPSADLEAVVKAVGSGKLSEQLIRERCVKVLMYKYLFVIDPAVPAASAADIKSAVNSPEAETLLRRLAASSVTLLENHHSLIPLRDLEERSVAVVSLGAKASNPFAAQCARYMNVTSVAAPDGALTATQLASLKKCNTIIVGVFKQNEAVKASLAKLDIDDAEVVACVFLNPYKMARMEAPLRKMDALISTFDDTRHLEEAAAQAVFGGIAITGRMPVNLKGWLHEGEGHSTEKTRLGFSTPEAMGFAPRLEERYDSIVRQAVADGAVPGCQVLIARGGNVVLDKCYGSLSMRGTTPVTPSTIYDIASMSKALGTVAALMKAYDKGKFHLSDPIGKFVPELRGTPKENITMKALLLHESGMPSGLSMYSVLLDTATYCGPAVKSRPGGDYTVKVGTNAYISRTARLRGDLVSRTPTKELPTPIGEGIFVGQATFDTIARRVFDIPLKSPVYRYSDLNFVLLMLALEKMEGRRLDEFVEEEIFAPIGADNTMYIPLLKGVDAASVAPTEKDPFLRAQTVRGYPHDELAAFSGGIQGNAGLFSTADDVAKLCQTWLNGGVYGGERIFKEATVRTFTCTRSASGGRALGFDTAPPKSGVGPKSTYGHTGFTGTQFKIDPESGTIFIFLSNRVNPTRDNAAFVRSDIRAKLWVELYR